MMKAMLLAKEGQRGKLVLGLTFENLDFLRQSAGDGYIPIEGKDFGLSFDIMICSGATEVALLHLIQGGIGPDTKVEIDEKLKS